MSGIKREKGRGKSPRMQYAALPFRFGQGLEVLLVTSRGTGRWVIPKGWPVKRLPPHKAAEREALEEAGINGVIEPVPLGRYEYDKHLSAESFVRCAVDVFPLRVTRERSKWREKGQRTRRWFPAEEAATLVDEPELRRLIDGFDPPEPATAG